jgi:HSF-type DNA-binding
MTSKNTEKSPTLSRSIAAVSSGSSLDSFSRNVPQHSHESQISNSSVEDRKQVSPYIQTVKSITEVNESYGKVTENQPIQTCNTVIPVKPGLPSTKLLPNVASISSSSAVIPNAVSNAPVNSTVAEFLYQLTKMLTDDNREVIEWSNSRIEVHNPHRLANEILHKYFRHSKFASFQRQLNYFGFRKLAGKGKMAPCSYVNDATTSELRSILLIKVRKFKFGFSHDILILFLN